MALVLGGRVVAASRGVLLHLPKDPRIGGGGAADHDGIAAGFADHALGVLGRVNVAIADDGNFHRLLHGGNDTPVGSACVALQPRARMDSDAFDAEAFRHFGDLDGNDGVFVPAGAEFDGYPDFDGGAAGFENFAEGGGIAP